MKGFLIFLVVVFMLIGGYIYYGVTHPTKTQIIRNGANWIEVQRPVNRDKK